MPTVTLYESEKKFAQLRPADDVRNWMKNIEDRADWTYWQIPLAGDALWKLEGERPTTLNYLTIEFFPWGDLPVGLWLDGMNLKAEEGKPLLTTQNPDGTLAGWNSFHEDPKAATGDVWKLADGVLTCKGSPKGYIYTKKPYTNFVLTLEWRTPPGGKAGNGGVLLRKRGQDRIWPRSLEAQLNAGEEGDFWGLAGFGLSGPADRSKTLEHPDFGRLTNLKRTRNAVKKPGEWNRYEIIADGGTITLKINGQEVNRTTSCDVLAGPICLTAEGDEIHFRNVRVKEA